MDRQARRLLNKREKDDRFQMLRSVLIFTKIKSISFLYVFAKSSCPCLEDFLSVTLSILGGAVDWMEFCSPTLSCLFSNDEVEEGEPASDSDFEVDTKKEVRRYPLERVKVPLRSLNYVNAVCC